MEFKAYTHKQKVIGLISQFTLFVIIMHEVLYKPETTVGAVWGVTLISSILYFCFYLIFTSPKGTKISVIQGVMVPNRNIKLLHFFVFFKIFTVYLLIGYGLRWLAS